MRSLPSMTGTGDFSCGDTLAGGGAAEAGDRMLGLLLSALPARRAPCLRGVTVSVEIYAVKRRRRTFLVEDGDFFIIACRGIRSGRYYARCICLLRRRGGPGDWQQCQVSPSAGRIITGASWRN